MNRVLLISTNPYLEPYPVFPLGLAFIDAALRREGYQTRWHDLLCETASIEQVCREFQPQFVGISIRNIDDVLIHKQCTFFDDLRALCARIRAATDCRIILGGSGFSIFPTQLLELSTADYGIVGEGESSFGLLLEALRTGRDPSPIPGLVYRQGPESIVNPPMRVASPKALDLATWPADLVRYYLETSSMLSVQTQRGCPYACAYCTYPVIEGSASRPRAAAEVVDEMRQIKEMGAQYVFIVDSVFNCTPGHVAEVCEELLRQQVKLRWACFLRPQGLTRELMRLMAASGLAHVEFGSDSLCDSVLAAYGKRFSFDDIFFSSELTARENIDFCHFLICGGPGETEETLLASYRNSLRLPGGVIMPMIGMRVYPGTELHRQITHAKRTNGNGDWLRPTYYIAPGLDEAVIGRHLQSFAQQTPSWIVGEPPPTYRAMAEKLRRRGVVGPLWGYLAAMRRIMPVGSTAAPRQSP